MKSQQINFYALPDDLETFVEGLREATDLAIVGHRSPSATPITHSTTHVVEAGAPLLYLYLSRVQELDQIVMDHVPAQGYWVVDVIRSPVIELNRSYFDGTILRRGRLYVVKGYWGDEEWIDKPTDFVAWAKRVLDRARRSLVRHEGKYLGKKALEWLKTSGGRLVD